MKFHKKFTRTNMHREQRMLRFAAPAHEVPDGDPEAEPQADPMESMREARSDLLTIVGIGAKTKEKLEAMGITTVETLAQADDETIIGEFGPKQGASFLTQAREKIAGNSEHITPTERVHRQSLLEQMDAKSYAVLKRIELTKGSWRNFLKGSAAKEAGRLSVVADDIARKTLQEANVQLDSYADSALGRLGQLALNNAQSTDLLSHRVQALEEMKRVLLLKRQSLEEERAALVAIADDIEGLDMDAIDAVGEGEVDAQVERIDALILDAKQREQERQPELERIEKLDGKVSQLLIDENPQEFGGRLDQLLVAAASGDTTQIDGALKRGVANPKKRAVIKRFVAELTGGGQRRGLLAFGAEARQKTQADNARRDAVVTYFRRKAEAQAQLAASAETPEEYFAALNAVPRGTTVELTGIPVPADQARPGMEYYNLSFAVTENSSNRSDDDTRTTVYLMEHGGARQASIDTESGTIVVHDRRSGISTTYSLNQSPSSVVSKNAFGFRVQDTISVGSTDMLTRASDQGDASDFDIDDESDESSEEEDVSQAA